MCSHSVLPTRQMAPSMQRFRKSQWLSLLLLCLLVLACWPAKAALPPGWNSLDFGVPTFQGNADYVDGRWTISAGGSGVCSAGRFHFAWVDNSEASGITARLESVTGGDFFSQAGVMFRENATAGAVQAMLLATASNGIMFQYRGAEGASCSSYSLGGFTCPLWLKLARNGSIFSAHYSVDGTNWTLLGEPQNLAMTNRAMVGLVATANNETSLCTATFSNVAFAESAFGVRYEAWTNIISDAATGLAALTNTASNPNWPANPSTNYILPAFDTSFTNGEALFGYRLRGYVVPPASGQYQFWITGDDASELRFSPSEMADDATPIAWVSNAVAPDDWTSQSNQVSAPVQLTAGARYYLESRSVQRTGDAHLAVRWRMPDATIESPLAGNSAAGTLLIPVRDQPSPPGIYQHPVALTIKDGQDAPFSVLVTNQGPVSYQWRVGGTNWTGTSANNSIFVMPLVDALLYNGVLIDCVVSNSLGAITSTPALLTVVGDVQPPTILRGLYVASNLVQISFSEQVTPQTATNVSNYAFTNAVTIQRATIDLSNQVVTLETSPMIEGVIHAIVINGVSDTSLRHNVIASNSIVRFFAGQYAPEPVGNSIPAGSIMMRPDGYDLTGGGTDIGTSTETFQFAYKYLEGDFDISVRLRGLSQTDAFAKAGLMFRQNLTPGARYAAVICTPTIGGAFFSARSIVGAKVTAMGYVPVNLPYTWLRLRRVGTQYTGYASYDGQRWQQLGTIIMDLGTGGSFGMMVCSRDTTKTAVAEFRDLKDVTSASEGTIAVDREALGPSSRKTGLVISEIMYKPASRPDGRDLEFVEIFNSQPWFEELSGYRLGGDISFTFPEGTKLPAGAYLVVAANPTDMASVYGIQNVIGPYSNRLSSTFGTVELRDRFNALLLQAPFSDQPPWPASADGAGHSLVLARPSYGERSPLAWAASDLRGGSPGGTDGTGPEPNRQVRINEIMAHTDPPLKDFVELFNPGPADVDLSGCYLTDDPDEFKFRIPDGASLPAGGFLAFDETALGFRLDAAGEKVILFNAEKTRVLDAVTFSAQENGRSSGRYPNGAPGFSALATPTQGTANSRPYVNDIVINEILYNPVSGDSDDEFVELYNRGSQAVDLSGWKMTDGISYTFPVGTVIAPDGYIVLARNRSHIFQNYPALNPAVVVGDYSGELSNRGERLALSFPEQLISTNASGKVVIDVAYVLADEVTYSTGGRWGEWSDGGGSSLELIDPHADNNVAPNWADSDESAKAPWTTIEYTGVLDNGNGGFSPGQLQVFLMGPGECLLDDVEVMRAGQANLLSNGSFSSSTSGWVFQGTHRLSSLAATAGYGGGACLQVRASGRGDTGANRIRYTFSGGLTSGTEVTIRSKARWLRGNPEILLRLRGNWLEAAGRMQTPANVGSPGARNGRHNANAGPAITEVIHTPALPATTEPVTVTARVQDPDGISRVQLTWRNDGANGTARSLTMVDDGTAGDAIADDGVFSCTIPAPNSKTILAFCIEAADGTTSSASTRFPANAPTRECLIGFGEPIVNSPLGTYRLWVNRTNVSWWTSREKNSNEPLDGTFVYANSRVVYNMKTLYSGSPFHTPNYSGPAGNNCDYVMSMPDDDLVLGANDFVLATTGNLGNDETAQKEQAAFWIMRELGAPTLHRRHVFVYFNGNKRGVVYEDSQQPNSDVVEEYWPDDADGQLFKIEDWFEFDDAGSSFDTVDATLDNFTTTGGQKKVARYRWSWRPRAVKGSAHNFTNLFTLVDALHTTRPDPYIAQVGAHADVEEWMRVLAVERLVGNWDSFAYSRGKNMFIYKPERGPWQLVPWDIDFVFNLGDPATTGLTGGNEGNINTMREQPPFARAYWRAFYDAAMGPLQDARINPLIDAKYAGLQACGVAVGVPTSIKTYVTTRRNQLLSQLASFTPAFSVNSAVVRSNTAVLTGVAPVGIKTIEFNGISYPVTWTSVTAWTASVPLKPGQNPITVTGLNSANAVVATATRSVAYSGPDAFTGQGIVFSELMYAPVVPGTEYVELFNTSSNLTFDMSGWGLNGLSYTFPEGSLLAPQNYLVLARDRAAFSATYGVLTPVFDTFDGTLQNNGETLTLLNTNGMEIAKVRYEAKAPWPTNTPGLGTSLQLVDSAEDAWRLGNWEIAQTNSLPAAKWVYVSVTGTATTSLLYMYLASTGDIYLDDIQLVAGSAPGVGQNLMSNGDFESALGNEWKVGSIFSQSTRSTAVKHAGSASLHMVSTGVGSSRDTSIYQTISPALTTNATYTLSFWYLQTTNGGPLVLRLSYNGISTGNIDPSLPGYTAVAFSTPGQPNSVSRDLAAFPKLFINEVQAENQTGPTNRAGERTSWMEIFNAGTNSVALEGLYLSTNYQSLGGWSFPAGAVVPARGFRVVFTDGHSALSTATEPHTTFALPPRGGTLALSRARDLGGYQVIDYLSYTNFGPDHSYGSVPDGQIFLRREMPFVTPGRTNDGSSSALTVTINEWMADNISTCFDPVDKDYEDWFELYNYGSEAVDLGGYYLSDNTSDKFQFEIPRTGRYLIPAGGFLVVWADGEEEQNNLSVPDLHVNFKLSKDGEAIGLFGADGKAIDLVTFGAQRTDVSQGRYPDGASSYSDMAGASPGTNNVAPNTAPSLEPIPDQLLYVGEILDLQFTATDREVPTQVLTFSLGTPAPLGAGVNSATGFFRWIPTEPQTAVISVVVRDSGTPSLTATQLFSVVVLPSPQLTVIRKPDAWILSLPTIAGKTYQLEACDNLSNGQWFAEGQQLIGSGVPAEFTIQIAPTGQRFYRVRVD